MTDTINSYGVRFVDVDSLPLHNSDNIQQYDYPDSVHFYTAILDGSVHSVMIKDWTRVRNGWVLTYGNGSQVQIYKTKALAIAKARAYLTYIQNFSGDIAPTAQWHELAN